MRQQECVRGGSIVCTAYLIILPERDWVPLNVTSRGTFASSVAFRPFMRYGFGRHLKKSLK